MRKMFVLAVLALAAFAFAATPPTVLNSVTGAVADLCKALRDLLPVAGMLMIIFAGVIYAAGQMMGAETRARANVWATAALTGALIAILIAVVAPAVFNLIYPAGSKAFGPTGAGIQYC